MKLNVKLFAVAKQLVGTEQVVVELPSSATVGGLRAALCEQHPQLALVVSNSLFAVNSEFADDQTAIPCDAEVACIPPVSGG